MSYDSSDVVVPHCSPTDTVHRRVPCCPCGMLHLTALSAVQSVPSHALPPSGPPSPPPHTTWSVPLTPPVFTVPYTTHPAPTRAFAV